MIIDNALWHDKVADPANDEDETVIIREALEAVTNTEELVSALVPVGDAPAAGVADSSSAAATASRSRRLIAANYRRASPAPGCRTVTSGTTRD